MWCFTTDSSGHWFKIPVVYKSIFEDYVDAMENDKDWKGENFEKYRCMHPVNYMFKEISVLKESTSPFDEIPLDVTANTIFKKSKTKLRKN